MSVSLVLRLMVALRMKLPSFLPEARVFYQAGDAFATAG
jgi:hypothetical protein